jgi:DDE superfamily endonuclease
MRRRKVHWRLTLQNEYIKLLTLFASEFSPVVWAHAKVLLTGAILVRGQRTVASILRVMGLGNATDFENYHRVLNRAVWSALALARKLLLVLLEVFVPSGDVLIGGDETLERRRGKQIAAKGYYRDAVRSSKKQVVKSSGLKWVTIMLLTWVPFARRVWALPFLTLLAPSERESRRHKTQADWMRQALLQIRSWLPKRSIVFVGDAGYAVFDLLSRMARLKQPITVVTRIRMDAALYAPPPPRKAGQPGRPAKKGQRLPKFQDFLDLPLTDWIDCRVKYWYGEFGRALQITTGSGLWLKAKHAPLPVRWVLIRDPLGKFKPQALVCTDVRAQATQILLWFVQRWQMEVTHRELREHLGFETQRQWSALAILRSTPILCGLFSVITILAQRIAQSGGFIARRTAWYAKEIPTFSDAIAAVRLALWRMPNIHVSQENRDIAKLSPDAFSRFTQAWTLSINSVK